MTSTIEGKPPLIPKKTKTTEREESLEARDDGELQ